jgi:hypothetical protein
MTRCERAARFEAASNMAVLKPGVARAFPSADAVNDVLMGLIDLAKTTARRTRRSTRSRAKAARVS